MSQSQVVERMIQSGTTPFCINLQGINDIEQAMDKAKLNYNVKLGRLFTENNIELPNNKVTIREDNNKILGIVGNKYSILQNKDAFKFFEPFLDAGLATLESAGQLFGGKKVVVLARLNTQDMEVEPGDIVNKYIILSNSHDGCNSIRVGFTPIRVVCCNMLSMVHHSVNSKLIRVNHTGDVTMTLNELRETIDIVNQQFIATENQFKNLARTQINTQDLHRYVRQVFSNKSIQELEQIVSEKELIEQERKRLIARVEEIFDMEPVHNAWTMYNSVNYYLNHERGRSIDTRYNSLMFGPSRQLDNKALNLALSY